MSCKPCGRPLGRGARFFLAFGVITELVCWKCRTWYSLGGYLMPERRN